MLRTIDSMKKNVMKNLLFIFEILLLNIALNAQTPRYYYYEKKKQYLSLNTEYAFLSLKKPNIPDDILQRNINYTELQSDNSNKKQYQGSFGANRFYTRLDVTETLSEEQYLNLLIGY